ncbi:MAG: hypothetical protein IJB97_04665 [Clostridia bacterium]|nr:hypothetical protein [Clostridia bacterium]
MIRNFAEYRNTAFDIVVLAGQSNAQGYGEGAAEKPYEKDGRVYGMRDTKETGSVRFVPCEKNETPIRVNCPGICEIFVAEDDRPANMGFSFAREYVKNDLAVGRNLLLVYMAIGNTGFRDNCWGEGKIMTSRLFAAVDEALGLNPENRLVALLWHQGENDSHGIAEETEKFYYEQLKTQLEGFRNRYETPNLPIVSGGFASEWYLTNQGPCDAVLNATKKVCSGIGNAEFIETHDLKSNNQEIGNGDIIHFSRQSQYVLGERYYAAFQAIKDGR